MKVVTKTKDDPNRKMQKTCLRLADRQVMTPKNSCPKPTAERSLRPQCEVEHTAASASASHRDHTENGCATQAGTSS